MAALGNRQCAAISVAIVTVLALLTYYVEWSRLPKQLLFMGEDLSCTTSQSEAAAGSSVQNMRLSEWQNRTRVDRTACKHILQDGDSAWVEMSLHHFIKESKNPCWWRNEAEETRAENETQLDCLPYFFLAGVSKCGSTDIFNRLMRHPQMVTPSRKEPSWFDWRRFSADVYPFEWYLSTFESAAAAIVQDIETSGISHRVVGDGSPTYFWRNFHWDHYPENQGCGEPQVINPQTIHALLPHAKIIFSFRNPVTSIYSKYLSLADKGFQPSPQLFHAAVVREIQRYQDCFARSSVRSCVYNTSLSTRAEVRLEKGLYAIFLSDWFRVFPRGQIHIIRFEDYIADISGHLQDMFDFLQLEILSDSLLQEIAALSPSNPGHHYNVGPMLNKTQTLLESFYTTFNEQLADMLDDKKFLWR